ncbi:MAG: esterase-like activity of phytase family protein [Dinoroseobacter sp.]|nr:esterase-like activity of phytase family protein [Dinoroseobacter sp.]
MRSSLGLALAILLSVAHAVAAEQAEYLGSFVWSSPDADFGGLSAFEILDDGAALLGIGDRGFLVSARIVRYGAEERIESVELARIVPLTDPDGRDLPEEESDAEGLALAPGGRVFISFEAIHGVAEFDLSGRMVSDGLLRHPDFPSMQLNSSLESLAIDDSGRLCTAPERSGRWERPFPAYCLEGGTWSQPFAIPRSGDFLLSGMDFGPDGRLYVLERALRTVFFATRVRSFALDGDTLSDERTLIETPSGTHDNLEGISVWADKTGALRISLISDDNYNLFQRTEIVEYRLP